MAPRTIRSPAAGRPWLPKTPDAIAQGSAMAPVHPKNRRRVIRGLFMVSDPFSLAFGIDLSEGNRGEPNCG